MKIVKIGKKMIIKKSTFCLKNKTNMVLKNMEFLKKPNLKKDKISPEMIEQFFVSNCEEILRRYNNRKLDKREAKKALQMNRWWIHYLRQNYVSVDYFKKRSDKCELEAYGADGECVFVIKYRGYNIPFYKDQTNETSFYAVIEKAHYCSCNEESNCLLSILDQIDIQLDTEAIEAISNKRI